MFKKIFGQKDDNDDVLLLELPSSDFIPYACHYDENTILTKNGELLQTIKIVGFTYETLGGSHLGLREEIRKAVLENIDSTEFSLYFHTVRRKQSLDHNPSFPTFFSQQLHSEWVEKNQWQNKYVNELYLTIIHSAPPVSVNLIDLLKYFRIGSLYKDHNEYLDKAHFNLERITQALLKALSYCGAIRLGLVEHEEYGYCSDLLKFFSKITHLEEIDLPLPTKDLSRDLTRYKIAFGNDTLEVKRQNNKFYGSILSIKQYRELPASALDEFLQLPQEMVITQTINFVNKKEANKHCHYQNYVLGVSGDNDLKSTLGLDAYFDPQKNSPVDYCSSQLTIMVISDSIDDLNQKITRSGKELALIGYPAVKEDLNLEHCFWSQLPANFRYISRKSYLPTAITAGMASLHNFPVGSLSSKWGEAITILKTALGTPYFFNFHVGENGHCFIVGDPLSGKVTLLNFLLSESLKLQPNIFYLDSDRSSEIFIKAVGGKYLSFNIKAKENSARFNPLLLEDTKENRSFLCNWLLYLMDKYINQDQLELYTKLSQEAVEVIFTLPQEKRRLSNAAEFFINPAQPELNQKIIVKLSKWFEQGKYGNIFDNPTDDLQYRNKVLALDISELCDTDISFNLPVLYYLIHFFKINFKGMPSILAISGANKALSNLYFEQNLGKILDELTNLNSIVVANGSFSSNSGYWSDTLGQIYQEKMASLIFMPDDSSYENVKRLFKLNQQEAMYLEALDSKRRQFIIKQSGLAIISEMSLNGLDTSLNILSCHDENMRNKILSLIAENGEANSMWVKKLYDTNAR